LTSVTRTGNELSIVCPLESVPQDRKPETAWVCFALLGPFSFSEVGILDSFISPLAEHGIPIFALSTYDTDYVLVREPDANRAIEIVEKAGHQLVPSK
jgi:uncharacterized protein